APLWLAPALAGLAAGWFALRQVMLLFPSLHGIERIRHRNVWSLLGAWIGLCAQRAVLLLALYAPPIALAWYGLRALGVPQDVMLAFVVPVVALAAHGWFASLVDNLAWLLDG